MSIPLQKCCHQKLRMAKQFFWKMIYWINYYNGQSFISREDPIPDEAHTRRRLSQEAVCCSACNKVYGNAWIEQKRRRKRGKKGNRKILIYRRELTDLKRRSIRAEEDKYTFNNRQGNPVESPIMAINRTWDGDKLGKSTPRNCAKPLEWFIVSMFE